MKATGCHFLSSTETCERTAPVAKSELSASMQNGFVESGEMRGDAFLESVKDSSFDSTPAPPCVILSQVEEWVGVFREALDEPLVEVGEFFLFVSRPVFDTSNLD